MIKFNQEDHTYTKDNYEYLTSTQLVSAFSPEFERDRISKAVADRDDRTQEDVLNEWDLKREVSCDFGNAIHKSVELWVNHGVKPNSWLLQELIDKLTFDRDEVISEKIFSDDSIKLAGTIDLIKLSEPEREPENQQVELIDIKTNNNFEKSYNKMLEPFEDLDDNKLNQYRMQLTIYKLLSGLNVFNLAIIKPDFKDMDWTAIDIEPIKEVEDMGLEKLVEHSGLNPKKIEGDLINNLI